jgi:hypothetical protein
MSATALYTANTDFRKVLATNSTASAYAAKADVVTLPSSAGYVDLSSGSPVDYVPNTVLFKFFGTDADNETGSVRVYGVRTCRNSSNEILSYTHVLLGEWAFILSALTGVAAGVVVASEFYADTITRTTGIENVADQILSPTSDEPAHLLMDTKGHSLLFVELIVGTSASVNALYAGV